MEIISGKTAYKETRKSAVAVGYFDGMHVGHMALIRAMLTAAEAGGLASVLLTFDMSSFRAEGKGTQDLITRAQKVRIAEETGVEYFAEIPFEKVRDLSPEKFVEQVLGSDFLKAEIVCIGTDFRFGKGRKGSAEDLVRIGKDAGFRTLTVEEVCVGDTIVSTSAIKELIRDGRIGEADVMLGYPYRIEGTVIHGNHLAAGMGFPTANLLIPKETVPPRRGVYLSRTLIGAESYKSITNIGTRPTVTEDTEPTAETHLLDFSEDLYGKSVAVLLYEFIRPEQRFSSAEDLIRTVRANIEYAESKDY